ncbi:MAG: phosphoenolpyruvate--protein phosphotransferase [Pseudonocardiaceae bacterium]
MSALVGIVVVSHSRALARAAVDLAHDMLHGVPVQIITAAGLDDTTFGTDTGQVTDAIAAADQGAGVVVLMDLGGAVLCAKLALDLLDDARSRVVLCPAPLVEGLIVAAVAAAGGATRDEVAAEARQALAGKLELLTPAIVADQPPDDAATVAGLTGVVIVMNQHGLHARPAARIVQEVRAHGARVELRNRSTSSAWVSAASLSKILTLGALCGHEVEIRVSGDQPREVLDHLLALAARGFGDEVIASPVHGGATTRRSPLPASPGIGVGPARRWEPAPVVVPDGCTDDPVGDWRRFQDAIAAARHDLHQTQAGTAVIGALGLLLDDPVLHDEVRSRINGGQAAAPAWSTAATRIADELAALPDPYQQARAADLRGLRDQVLRALLGTTSSTPAPAGVLICADLTPSEAAGLDPALVTAVLLAGGSPTAHSAILLRARGIPAVVAAGPAVLGIAEGTLIALDGSRGEFVIDPPADVLAAFRARAEELVKRTQHVLARAASRAVTRDGIRVLVGANIGAVQDARTAADHGADLAGLVRTEFLFLDRPQAPGIDEQEATYREIAEHLNGRRIVLRTLDVGGDKPLSYFPRPTEANPFLGNRGTRPLLTHPRLLADQLLAIVRLAHDVPVSVMFPMISTLEEFRRARSVLDDAIKRDGRGRPASLYIGIMVEVPATALKALTFAPFVDFFSIGTNDLTQYTLAAERGNAAVAHLCDPLDPAVLRLIDMVCRGAWPALVAVCGEMAADERAAGLLVGLGVRELSVAPAAIPTIKQAIRGLNSSDAAELGVLALDADSAVAVRELLTRSPLA